jgi:hypothetical protein
MERLNMSWRGYPSAPNQVIGGAKVRGIIGGWWWLFKGGFDECSIEGWKGKMYIDLILSSVKEVEKEDEEEEKVDMRRK